jgi:hypothetical protein
MYSTRYIFTKLNDAWETAYYTGHALQQYNKYQVRDTAGKDKRLKFGYE